METLKQGSKLFYGLEEEGEKLSIEEENLLGQLEMREGSDHRKYELVRTVRSLRYADKITCDQESLLVLHKAHDFSVLKYQYTNDRMYNAPHVEEMPMPTNWSDYRYVFSKMEISTFIANMSQAKRNYFKRETGMPAIIMYAQRTTTLMTMFNVEALVQLYKVAHNLTSRGQEYACSCVYNLVTMPVVAQHKCRVCGGTSCVDESLGEMNPKVKRIFYESKFRFMLNSSLVIKVGEDYYCDKVVTMADVERFITSILEKEIEPLSAVVEPSLISRVLASPTEEVCNSLESQKKVAEKMVILRVEVEQGSIVNFVAYNVKNKEFIRGGRGVNIQDIVSSTNLIIDPDHEKYSSKLTMITDAGDRIPQSWRGGFRKWGTRYSGSIDDQLKGAVREFTGIKIKNYSQAWGVYGDNPSFPKYAFSMKYEVIVGDIEIVCLGCKEPISHRKRIIAIPPRVGYYGMSSVGYCEHCVKIAQSYVSGSYTRCLDQIGLSEFNKIQIRNEKGRFYVSWTRMEELSKKKLFKKKTYGSKSECEIKMKKRMLRQLAEEVLGDTEFSRRVTVPRVANRLKWIQYIGSYQSLLYNQSSMKRRIKAAANYEKGKYSGCDVDFFTQYCVPLPQGGWYIITNSLDGPCNNKQFLEIVVCSDDKPSYSLTGIMEMSSVPMEARRKMDGQRIFEDGDDWDNSQEEYDEEGTYFGDWHSYVDEDRDWEDNYYGANRSYQEDSLEQEESEEYVEELEEVEQKN